MKARSMFSLLFLTLSLTTILGFQSASVSTVHIYVLESYGGALAPLNHPKRAEWNKSVKVQFLSRVSKKPITEVTGTSLTVQLPLGEYDIRISAPGFVTETRRVDVAKKECWLMFGIRVGMLEVPSFSTLTGNVVHDLPHEGVTWLKLVSLYSDIVMDTSVEKSGFFVFRYVPHGRYLLVVLHGTRVCEKRLISLKEQTHSLHKTLGERCLMDEETASEFGNEDLDND